VDKIALAYSGSLDTTLCIHWLKEYKNFEVLALAVDVGLQTDLVSLGDRAIRAGAASAHILDLREKFCQEFILPSLKAGLQASNGDPYATALGRPAICQALVNLAREHGTPFIAHGCKPNSDDQIRFENALFTLDKNIEVINPIKLWHLKSREQKLRYARQHNLPLDFSLPESEWSLDGNLWGKATVLGDFRETWKERIEPQHRLTTNKKILLSERETVVIEFRQGQPIALDGHKMPLRSIIQELNALGNRHDIGSLELVYHRLNGMKARKIIENPGATLLLFAHRALEEITLDRETLRFKEEASWQNQKLLAQGFWFSLIRESLDLFFHHLQYEVTGEIHLELHQKNLRLLGRRSSHTLICSEENKGPSGRWIRPGRNVKKQKKHS
jgi:argininosuccinate synthase